MHSSWYCGKSLFLGGDKLVGQVSINLLCYTKSAAYIISIIIDAPAVTHIHTLIIKGVKL